MVVSISSSELSELIDSVKNCMKKKLKIELNIISDLSSAVKSYKDDPESLISLQDVVKLLFEICESTEVLSEATSNAIYSLLADCIMGTFNLLKKKDKSCESLCNDLINLVLVMSQKDNEASNLLLKYLSNSLITILIYPKFDTPLKRDFLKILNYILENSDRPLRYKLRNYTKLEKLGKLLYKCGDYDFQVNIIETLFRYTSTEDRKVNAKRWFNDKNGLISAFLNIVDFEPDCRKFLNLFNCSLMNERLVYSIPCCRAIIGNCEIQKPEHPSYEEFWVDFNLGSKSISLVCSQASLYSNSVLASQVTPGLWETILIEIHIIKKVHLRLISLPMDSQGVEKNIWELQLTLFHPCYAIFSSVACNFEGNLCIFTFSSSNAALVNSVLQPIFGNNYFSDMGSSGSMKKHKSSVSSASIVYGSDHGYNVSSINRNEEPLPRYPFKVKMSQVKENMDKEILKNFGSTHGLGNKITERMANNRSFKEGLQGSQYAEKSSNLTSKSKKQKSPFKPLEFINSSNLNKASNNNKKISLDQSFQSSSKPQSSESALKDLIEEKIPEESRSNVNRNSGMIDCNSSKEIQRNVSNEEPCVRVNEANCMILAEDSDENSDVVMNRQSKTNEGSRKAVASRNVKTSVDYQIDESQGRVLRSHVKAQSSLDANKSKKLKKAENDVPPLNSNDCEISKLMEAELNYSDSDEWLKVRRRKSTRNDERSQSLGVLHMKQLYNKEVAMEKAIKKRGKGKEQSLKQSHSLNSELNSSKKKLFNSKENSFLFFDGEKKRESKNITFHSDAKVVPTEKDDKLVSSHSWFSESDSEASWIKSGYRSRFDSFINEKHQFLKQSKSRQTCSEAVQKIENDNAKKPSGVKRDVHSCPLQMKAHGRNSESLARGDDISKPQTNKRRRYNRRKSVENDGANQKSEILETAENDLTKAIKSGSSYENNDHSKCTYEKMLDSKKKELLDYCRGEKTRQGEESCMKSDSKDKSRHENSFHIEFENNSRLGNVSFMNVSGAERLASRKISPVIQHENVNEIIENNLPVISRDVHNSSIDRRNRSSQDDCDECPETIISDNLNKDNPLPAKERTVDLNNKSPQIPYSKQQATISSHENLKDNSSRSINCLNSDQGRNYSDKHSDVEIIQENSKFNFPPNSGKALIEENGESSPLSSQKKLLNDKTEASLTNEHPKIDLINQVSDHLESQNIVETDENKEVISLQVLSKDDNEVISENVLPTSIENDINSNLSKNETEAIVSTQVNNEISSNENNLTKDHGTRRSNEIHNSSPELIILSGITNIESSPKMPASVNNGEMSNLSSVKQENLVLIESTPIFNRDSPCSVSNQKSKSNKAKNNSCKESLINEISTGYRLDKVDNSEDLTLRPHLTQALTNFTEDCSQNLSISEQNFTTLRGKTVQILARKKNPDLQEMLTKFTNSPSLQNSGSDLDLSLTEDEELNKNNTQIGCSTQVFNRKDKDSHFSMIKRTVQSKRQSEGEQITLIENDYNNYNRNIMDISNKDPCINNSKRRRGLNKNIHSPVEMNKEIFNMTSSNTGEGFNEIQEDDSVSDDCLQHIGIITPINDSQEKTLRQQNINSSKNSSGLHSRKRRIIEPESIGNINEKVFQYDSSFATGCNLNSKNVKKKVASGVTGNHKSAKQQNFASENIPDLQQILMVRFEEKTRKMKELGNLFLRYTEDGMESLKEEGQRIGNKNAAEYLKNLRDEICAVEEQIQKGVKIQEGLEKYLKHISEKSALKSNIDSSAIERLKRAHVICEEMHKENKNLRTSDYIELHNSKLLAKIKQMHCNYMKMEWKKELAKVQNQLKLFLQL